MAKEDVLSRKPASTIAIVEAPVSQWYARRAQLAAVVVGLVSDVLVTAVLSVFHPLLLAVVLGALTGAVCAFVTAVLVRVWPVLRVLWWWSFEITIAALVAGGWVSLAHVANWLVASLALLAATAAVFGPVRVRQFVWAWSSVVIVRHRLRLCFATLVRSQVRAVGGRPVALPLLVWAKPTPAGERVWLWLRPGLSLEDLEGKAGLIAVACIAKTVRIVAGSDRYAALVRVDIARRSPFAEQVESPLAMLIPRPKKIAKAGAVVPVSPAVPLVGLDLADIPEPPAQQPRGGRR